jgi:uncharacterized membrane protein YkoI
MIRTRWLLMGMAVIALALMGAATLPADEGCKKEEAKAKVELPEAAAKAIKDAFPLATIAKVKAEDEDGMKMFEVELKQDKAEIEVTVAPDGTIVEIETEVALKDVPEAARAAISKAADGAQIKEIAKEEIRAEVRKDDKGVATHVKLGTPKIAFKAELVKGDQKGEIEVAADGTVVEPLKWKVKGQDDDDDNDDDAKPEAKPEAKS